MDLAARQLLDHIALFLQYPGRNFETRLEAVRLRADGVAVDGLAGSAENPAHDVRRINGLDGMPQKPNRRVGAQTLGARKNLQ